MYSNWGKYKIEFIDQQEYKIIAEEIFHQNIYSYHTENQKPLIIDIGSHIGLSIIYFKDKYPHAKIIGYEPNPILFPILMANIKENGIEGVELHNKAVDVKSTIKPFSFSSENNWYSTGSFLENQWTGVQRRKQIPVQTVDIRDYLKQEVDLLKIDIEGYETKLIVGIKEELVNVKCLFVEYHPIKDSNLKKILSILRDRYNTVEMIQDGKVVKRVDTNKLTIIKAFN